MNILRNKRIELDLPIDVWAALSGIPASSLSLADRGTRDLPIERFYQANKTLDELRDLVAFHAPVPIAWKDVNAIRELLDHMRRAKSRPDAWELLRELSSSDPDAVCNRYGWRRVELIQRLTAAREQLHQITALLQESNL